ncbi:hypothetical protein FF011L_23560 [Roseimaritima multifibrata]|uniref:Uncharacterized protein n=1 Tax=Roseimaritima multifibrata TaxID=1930274 RepID=A0A517MFB8_9BACT|nr:hypothetical protein [Roseimaritima multifibrata]QDS93583.1 hypothetical protein FF011L_23560 [Roseimaritima multifibrata]
MKSLCMTALFALAATAVCGSSAEAGSPAPYSYGNLGFFNPYTFPSNGNVRTPPYFSVHPPVYYSTRHARPYGMSPFAAPPMVMPAENYRGRQDAQFTPRSLPNPFCTVSPVVEPVEDSEVIPVNAVDHPDFVIGDIQSNPFAGTQRVAGR